MCVWTPTGVGGSVSEYVAKTLAAEVRFSLKLMGRVWRVSVNRVLCSDFVFAQDI